MRIRNSEKINSTDWQQLLYIIKIFNCEPMPPTNIWINHEQLLLLADWFAYNLHLARIGQNWLITGWQQMDEWTNEQQMDEKKWLEIGSASW